MRVAIGDADPTYTAALAHLLGDAGLEFVGAAVTAAALVELVIQANADVVAVDVRLPGGPSYVVAQLRERAVSCRVVAMSALLTPITRSAAADAGLSPLISKLEGEQLIAAIRAG